MLFIHSDIPTVFEDTDSILMVEEWRLQWDITTKHIVRRINLPQSLESMLRLTWQWLGRKDAESELNFSKATLNRRKATSSLELIT